MFRTARIYLRHAPLCAVLFAFAATPAAHAGPLGLPLPQPGPILRDTVHTVRDTTEKVKDTVTNTVDGVVAGLPLDVGGRPIDPTKFEQDDNGARVLRGVVIALALSDRGRDAAKTLDIEITRREDFDPLDLDVTTLKAPPGMTAAAAIKALRATDPKGTYDFEHVYNPSGNVANGAAKTPVIMPHDDIKIGMIDAGIDRTHPAFRDADITVKNTTAARGDAKPTAHGTAVASLLVGDDSDFRGALPGAELYAADAFGSSPIGGTAEDITRALAWLVDKDVPVINISISGPKNALLEAAVRGAIKRGHVIVAAVGNDGPATAVKYPAAYDGVIAVTSVDGRHHLQIDANRGPSIAFAAPGVDVRVAQLAGKYGTATGTSFASPIVAARFAELLPKPDTSLAAAARFALMGTADRPPSQVPSDKQAYVILESPPSLIGDQRN